MEEKLCASCDRCRSRKTKCDGKRPCGNCAAKYMKQHKLTNIDEVDPALVECVYSPAKRRGPVPGRSAQVRKADEMENTTSGVQQGVQGSNGSWSNTAQANVANVAAAAAQMAFANVDGRSADDLQQLSFLQHLQQAQALQQQKAAVALSDSGVGERSARRVKVEETQQQMQQGGIPRTVSRHAHLLDRNDPEGSRLLAYYKLSIDELFRLPPTPTDEEYCARLNIPGMTPRMIPVPQLAALSAARFAEIALGAIVHNEVSLAMELCNAVVHCLRESVQEPVQSAVLLEVAKAYFLLGVFRACRGDMARYFKYRRVCMTYIGQLESDARTATIIAAVSYLDSWAYMIYNANEKIVPDVDDTIPPVQGCGCGPSANSNNPIESKYNVATNIRSVVSDPRNKNWIQGAPPVYLNNEAPLHARSLDALACAVRTCCDQANSRFAQMSKEQLSDDDNNNNNGEPAVSESCLRTPTATAVLAHENELCSRNMVLSAYTLMQQHESGGNGKNLNEGLHMVISAMDAFLENSDDVDSGGFTDSQIQSLLSVCNTAVENPFLLHHAGPTYHMVTNAAILLCHLLNGMYAMKGNDEKFGDMETAMFEEVLDTFIAVRKLLMIHRRKLPVKLRCHGIPRPNFQNQFREGHSFIDLGETLLCACRGCQGFVLMACSPCVAAERARDATKKIENELLQESQAVELGELDRELEALGAEFDVDDDNLLGLISSLISS